MNRFLRTKNTDEVTILIPIEDIKEIVLYDKEEHLTSGSFTIMIFVKDEHTAAGREDYEDVEVARLRFDTIDSILNS